MKAYLLGFGSCKVLVILSLAAGPWTPLLPICSVSQSCGCSPDFMKMKL